MVWSWYSSFSRECRDDWASRMRRWREPERTPRDWEKVEVRSSLVELEEDEKGQR